MDDIYICKQCGEEFNPDQSDAEEPDIFCSDIHQIEHIRDKREQRRDMLEDR